MKNIQFSNTHLLFFLLFIQCIAPIGAQTLSLQEECNVTNYEFKGEKVQTLCEGLGNTSFTIEIGQGSTSGIVNSSQLGALPLNPKIRIVGNFSVIQGAPLTLTGAIIKIAPPINQTVLIEVKSGSSLTLDNCKMFACNTLWKGIKMESSSVVRTKNNTEIEDAEAAIHGDNIEYSYLEIENTTFNRNKIGLRFENTSYLPHSVTFFKFSGNKFYCDAALNGTTNGIADAGIRLKNIYQPFLSTQANNTMSGQYFHGLEVSGEYGNIDIQDFHFIGIRDAQIHFTGNTLRARRCEFANMELNGIFFGEALNLDIEECEFTSTNQAVLTQLTQATIWMVRVEIPLNACNIRFYNNHFYTEGSNPANWKEIFGIAILPLEREAHVLITKNVFDISGSNGGLISGRRTYCIQLATGFTKESDVLIEQNIFNLNPHLLTEHTAVYAFHDLYNVRVIGNTITGAGKPFIFAFCDTDGDNEITSNTFEQNTLLNSQLNSVPYFTFGMNIKNFWNLTICSNTNNSASYVAYLFNDQNYNTKFSSNITYGQSQHSLWISSGPAGGSMPLIGQQERNNNQWWPGNVMVGPFPVTRRSFLEHSSTDVDVIEMSKFIVHTDQSVFNTITHQYNVFSEFHPATDEISPDAGTLDNSFFEKIDGSLNATCAAQFTGGGPDKVDESIANGHFETLAQNPVITWDAKRYLFHRLSKNPAYANSYPLLSGFQQAESTTNVGRFYQIEQVIADANTKSSLVRDGIQKTQDKIVVLADQLSTALDLNAVYTVSNEKQQKDAELLDWIGKYQTDRLSGLVAAQQLLQNVVPTTNHEKYRKVVLEILLIADISQGGQLTEQQIAILQPIAELCVSEGGTATYMAASRLPDCIRREVEQKNERCSDFTDGLKPESSDRQGRTLPATDFSIAPNPAHGNFQVTLSNRANGLLRIYSLTGQLLQTVKVQDGSCAVQTDLPNGIYLCQLTSDNGRTYTQKLAIQQ